MWSGDTAVALQAKILIMGLLPLPSVEPESISSQRYMIIKVGHEVTSPSVLDLGAYTKASSVYVALVSLGPSPQRGAQPPEKASSRPLFFQPLSVCRQKEGREGGRVQDRLCWGKADLQVGCSRGWPLWKCIGPFGVRPSCCRELCFGVYNWSLKSDDAFDVVPYQQCALIVPEWLAWIHVRSWWGRKSCLNLDGLGF